MATPEAFRRDPRSPRIERAVAAVLANRKVVAPVDVFVRMDIHLPKDLDDSRFGRVPCLERAIRGRLWRLSRLLQILGYHCHDLNLVASQTAYAEWRKGAGTPYSFTKDESRRRFRGMGAVMTTVKKKKKKRKRTARNRISGATLAEMIEEATVDAY